MIRAWDYFMRRKGILLLILAVFLTSSTLSYNVLRSQATDHPVEYIRLQHWGDAEVAVPNTGGSAPVVLAILQPREVTSLTPRLDNEVAMETDPTPDTPDPLETSTVPPDGEPNSSDEEGISDEVAENNPTDDPTDLVVETVPEDASEDALEVSDQTSSETDPANESDDDVVHTEPTAQGQDLPEVKAGDDAASEQDFGYLVFLVVIGLIVAGFGTYFLEQHFWR